MAREAVCNKHTSNTSGKQQEQEQQLFTMQFIIMMLMTKVENIIAIVV